MTTELVGALVDSLCRSIAIAYLDGCAHALQEDEDGYLSGLSRAQRASGQALLARHEIAPILAAEASIAAALTGPRTTLTKLLSE